jgi:hypothetical protein
MPSASEIKGLGRKDVRIVGVGWDDSETHFLQHFKIAACRRRLFPVVLDKTQRAITGKTPGGTLRIDRSCYLDDVYFAKEKTSISKPSVLILEGNVENVRFLTGIVGGRWKAGDLSFVTPFQKIFINRSFHDSKVFWLIVSIQQHRSLGQELLTGQHFRRSSKKQGATGGLQWILSAVYIAGKGGGEFPCSHSFVLALSFAFYCSNSLALDRLCAFFCSGSFCSGSIVSLRTLFYYRPIEHV